VVEVEVERGDCAFVFLVRIVSLHSAVAESRRQEDEEIWVIHYLNNCLVSFCHEKAVHDLASSS
jgi:hypothetical protein